MQKDFFQKARQIIEYDVHSLNNFIEAADIFEQYRRENPPESIWGTLGHLSLGVLISGGIVASG
jgi:hypothetical protein